MKAAKMPNSNTLFRFLNRNKITGMEINEKRFIYNQNEEDSEFLTALIDVESEADIKAAIATVVAGFTPLKTVKEVNAINPAMMKFGEWISHPSSRILSEETMERTAGLTALTESQLTILWDNVYYYSITTGNEKVRNAIAQLLRANNFYAELVAYMTENPIDPDNPPTDPNPAPELVSLAYSLRKASVVIPTVLVKREAAPADPVISSDIDFRQRNALLMLAKSHAAHFNLSRLKTAVDEIKNAKQKFEKEQDEEYRAAFNLYNAALQELIDEAPIDPDTGEIIMPTAPNFEFEPTVIFDDDYLSDTISEDSFDLYVDSKKITHRSIDDTVGEMEKKEEIFLTIFASNTIRDYSLLAYNGVKLEVNNKPADNSYVLTPIKLYSGQNLFALLFTHFNENPDGRATFVGITLNPGEVDEISSTSRSFIYQNENSTSFLLYPKGVEINFEEGEFDFDLTIDTLNPFYGHSIEFELVKFPMIGRKPSNPDILDGEPGSLTVPIYGLKKLEIADFYRVEQEIFCYVPGEVSHIENIMAREYKEKSARNLSRTETTLEESTEREVEDLTDTTTADRYEMNSEISRIVQEDISTQLGTSLGVSGTWAGVTVASNFNANFSFSSSETNSFNHAESYAQDVTQRAMTRLVEKVSSKRTSRMLREFEETNKHGFDNREGDKHVTGIYRWVDKIYKNTLVNYGRRLMYNFMIPEPAKNFKHWMTQNPEANNQVQQLVMPKHPSLLFGIENPPDVYFWNYGRAAAEYGVEIDPPPPAQLNIGKSFSDSPANTGVEFQGRFTSGHNFNIEIPDGYVCRFLNWSYAQYQVGSAVNKTKVTLNICGLQVVSEYANARFETYPYSPTPLDNVEKQLEISLSAHQVGGFSLNFLAYCYLKDETLMAWKHKAFLTIMEGYNTKMRQYHEAMAALETGSSDTDQIDYNFNPVIGRNIEQRELKRLCIEMMTKPFGINIGQNHYHNFESNGNFKINQTAALDKYADIVRFFEEAFDWNIMSYMFHPYFWGKESDWKNLIKEKSSADYIFQAFLQSGMAQVTLPVKPGYERSVLYFLDTGKIMSGDDFALETYIDVINQLAIKQPGELNYVQPPVWLSRIPSALTIIQSEAAPLQGNGLPCFCEDGNEINFIDGTVLTDCEPYATGNNLLEAAGVAQNNAGSFLQGLTEFIANGGQLMAALNEIIQQQQGGGGGGGGGNQDCSTLFAELTTITASREQAITDFENSTNNCQTTLTSLNKLLNDANALLAQANNAKCDLSDYNQEITALNAAIAEVSLTCACNEIAETLATHTASHAQIMSDYTAETTDCTTTLTALGTLLTELNTLLADAISETCSVTEIEAEIESVETDITTVTAECE